MTKFQGKYRAESNRWQYWDYSVPGRYFLTNCILDRECILGDVKNGIMNLSEFGEIVKNEILNMPYYHPRVLLDEWVVMPNHIHLIIELGDYGFDNGVFNGDDQRPSDVPPIAPWWSNPDYQPTSDEIKQYRKQRRRMIIPKISGKMKMISSKQINIIRKTPGRNNWQHDYYDHVIRNEQSYQRIKQYIINNPRNWDEDSLGHGKQSK